MPNSTDRKSLSVSLEKRYETQHAGGAFDAKNIKTKDLVPLINSVQSAQHTQAGFRARMIEGNTELFEAMGESSLESSLLIKGFNNTKYGDTVNLR